MREGLYSVKFSTLEGPHVGAGQAMGSGVVNLRGGIIAGGDDTFYYSGKYTLDGTRLDGAASINRHTMIQGSRSIFGTEKTEVELKGSADIDGQLRIFGTVTKTGDRFQASLRWLAD